MSAERIASCLVLSLFAGTAGAAAGAAAEPTLPFSVQDMVRMERISGIFLLLMAVAQGIHIVWQMSRHQL